MMNSFPELERTILYLVFSSTVIFILCKRFASLLDDVFPRVAKVPGFGFGVEEKGFYVSFLAKFQGMISIESAKHCSGKSTIERFRFCWHRER